MRMMTRLHFRLVKTQRGRGRVREKAQAPAWREAIFSPPRQGRRATASSAARERGQREETLSSLAFSLCPSLFLFLSVSVHQIMKMSRNQWPHSFHCLFRRGWDDTYWILINKKRDTECACVCVGGQNKTQHTVAEEPNQPTPHPSPALLQHHTCLTGDRE